MPTLSAPDRDELATKALAYYDSASPKTISRNDSVTGEKYSVLDAAAGLAAALRLFVGESAQTSDAAALLDELGIGYVETVDDEGDPSFYLFPQFISRDEEEGESGE